MIRLRGTVVVTVLGALLASCSPTQEARVSGAKLTADVRALVERHASHAEWESLVAKSRRDELSLFKGPAYVLDRHVWVLRGAHDVPFQIQTHGDHGTDPERHALVAPSVTLVFDREVVDEAAAHERTERGEQPRYVFVRRNGDLMVLNLASVSHVVIPEKGQ